MNAPDASMLFTALDPLPDAATRNQPGKSVNAHPLPGERAVVRANLSSISRSTARHAHAHR